MKQYTSILSAEWTDKRVVPVTAHRLVERWLDRKNRVWFFEEYTTFTRLYGTRYARRPLTGGVINQLASQFRGRVYKMDCPMDKLSNANNYPNCISMSNEGKAVSLFLKEEHCIGRLVRETVV